MKALLCLGVIVFFYYFIYDRFPYIFSLSIHLYMLGFIVIYLIMYYVLTYQRGFAYEVMSNMNTASNKPLYDINSLSNKENQMDLLKNNLAMRQGYRCINCQNPILQKDFNSYKINYIKPLQFGGENNINNLGVSCSTCNAFRPY